MEKGDNNLPLIFAFIAGALCGAGAVLLLAPLKGEEARKRIKEVGERIKEKGVDFIEKTHDLIEEGKKEVEDFIKDEKGELLKKKSIIAKAIEAGKRAMKEETEKVKGKA